MKKLSMGLSVGSEGHQSSGTIGAFVEERDDQNNCGFLTCSHVCFDLQTLCRSTHTKIECSHITHKICQPSYTDNRQGLAADTVFCGKVCSYYFGDLKMDTNRIVGVDIRFSI